MTDMNLELNECFLKSNPAENEVHINKTSTKLYVFLKRYLKQCQLVLKSIIPDLKSFKAWQLIVLVLYATFNMTFSILVNRIFYPTFKKRSKISFFLSQDFNFFFSQDPNRSIIKWKNDFQDGVPLWRRILLCFSGISSITTVLNVVLVIHGKMSSYFWGILGAVLYGSFAFAFGYVGDAQLFALIFLPTQFVGIYIWSKQLDNQATTRVRALSWNGWLLTIFSSCFLVVFFYFEIPCVSKSLTGEYLFETRAVPHLLDALTNGCSVVGQILLIACYFEQYIIWTFVNLILIVMYSGKK